MSAAEIFQAIAAGSVEDVRRIVARDRSAAAARNDAGLSAVIMALYHHQWEAAEGLGDAWADMGVLEAAGLGRVERLRQLLGEDPTLVNARSADGFGPLHYAAYFGRPNAVRLLLQRGSPVAAVTDTPLRLQPIHSAVAGPAATRSEVVELLLAAGADPNARQQHGFTPLQAAANAGDVAVTRMLLSSGADPSLRNNEGQSARDIAQARGHASVADLLV